MALAGESCVHFLSIRRYYCIYNGNSRTRRDVPLLCPTFELRNSIRVRSSTVRQNNKLLRRERVRDDLFTTVTRNALVIDSRKPRALSLRNLVSGYECGRVFPAGVGPGSPSKDAVNWPPSRFIRSVETRRRYGWLRGWCSQVRASSELQLVPFGRWRHARGKEHCRGEPGSALSVGYVPDSARAEGSSIVDDPGEC